MSDELSVERIEALRARLGLPAGPRAAVAEASPRPADGRGQLKALARRTLRPVAGPALRRFVDLLTPAASERVAERLLGQLVPEVQRLKAEVAVLRAELDALRRADPPS